MKSYVRPNAFVSGKCAFAIILLTVTAGIVSAQTNTFPSSGNAGVGTTTPNVKLAVGGSGTNVYNTDVWAENNIHVQGNETLTQGGRGRLRIGTAWGYMGIYSDASSTSVQNDLMLGSGSGNVRVGPGIGGVVQNLIIPNGSIGLGTTAPGALVDLASTAQINNRLLLSGQEFFAAGNSSTSGVAIRLGTNREGERQLWFADSSQAINATNVQLRMRFFSNLASFDALTTDGTDVRPLILQSVGGNVGIGTSNPGNYKLNVFGPVFGKAIYTTYIADGLYGATAVPSRISTHNHDGGILFGYEDLGLGDYSPRVGLQQTNDAVNSPQITTVRASIGLVRNGNITVKGGASHSEFLRIDNSGNVGIGTSTPSTKLHVAGDVTVTGNIAAKYQDVAEWVPATRALRPGTVVTLSRTQSNLVEASAKAYDTRVAGVISEQPGITLGERGENKVLVATTGRVRIKVDATNAPIELGDLLVTSDQEGLAMKSEPVNVAGVQIHRPGTLIGKALEPLAKGQGEILVLLSLQ